MFLYMGIGWLLFKKKLITVEGSKSLANLLLYCILPCVILRSFTIGRTPEKITAFLMSFGLALLLLLLSMFIAFIVYRKSPIDNIGSAFSNAGFMGIPLVTSLLGNDAVFYAAGFVALLNALQWTYGQWIMSGDRKMVSFQAILKNPIILSLLIGIAVFLGNITIPEILASAMNSISALNAPIAMIILGVYLAQTDIFKIVTSPRLYKCTFVRLLLIPAFTILCLVPFCKGNADIITTLILIASAPIGSNVAVYAQKLGLDYTYAVQIICLSTIFSIFSMPLVIGAAMAVFSY